ncbi:hypothetical protein ABBQ38_011853 [Trebouxia sp. C0009 RCD-2024]
MAFAKTLFSNLFGKADTASPNTGSPAHQSPLAGHADIAFNESNPDEAKLAWLWREYEQCAQSDVKVQELESSLAAPADKGRVPTQGCKQLDPSSPPPGQQAAKQGILKPFFRGWFKPCINCQQI